MIPPEEPSDSVRTSVRDHALNLITGLTPNAGVVLDIGNGQTDIAEQLRSHGYEYVGCYLDKQAVDGLNSRGFEAHHLDISDRPGLTDQLLDIAGDREVVALTLLDTLAYLPDIPDLIQRLGDTFRAMLSTTLVISVPNIAHFDVGAKLLMGRWDHSTDELLGSPEMSFFTERRLTQLMADGGFAEIQRDDVCLVRSDQHFPADHPAFVDGSPLSMFLWQLRRHADAFGRVSHFVRAFTPTNLRHVPVADPSTAPFLSVLVRTQGHRMSHLLEALTCLAAQSVTDFETLILIHSDSGAVVERVGNLLSLFDDSFRYRCRVIQVDSGGRARPLNVGLDLAVGQYLAFLDEDDHVTSNWVGAFLIGAESHRGQIIRSTSLDRRAESLDSQGLVADWKPLGPLERTYGNEFDFLEHLNENRTPIHSFAVPLIALRALGLHFNESLPVVEDWDVLLRLASLTGVHNTRACTSIYHRWRGGESSQTAVDQRVWSAARQVVLSRLDSVPLLLPPGSATRIADSSVAGAALDPSACPEYVALKREREELQASLDEALQELERFETSEFWKLTSPLRRAIDRFRRLLGLS